ncbi:hypothetical protein [Shewanella aestuarii]|uniref:hypothetical protein n=1 Tax=Shewanella aestuarii TaxID=1028752 RepID=UPI001FCB463D|nr:hypothetical protein [Shewanella aestuarii]
MKTHRTAAQWLELLQQRNNFKGTNIEFCQHHNVAITTYYKRKILGNYVHVSEGYFRN